MCASPATLAQTLVRTHTPIRDYRQHLYLYEIASGNRVRLGEFRSEPSYTGEWRCDLHPRSSPDGTNVAIDSPHDGTGRQVYLVDISATIKKSG